MAAWFHITSLCLISTLANRVMFRHTSKCLKSEHTVTTQSPQYVHSGSSHNIEGVQRPSQAVLISSPPPPRARLFAVRPVRNEPTIHPSHALLNHFTLPLRLSPMSCSHRSRLNAILACQTLPPLFARSVHPVTTPARPRTCCCTIRMLLTVPVDAPLCRDRAPLFCKNDRLATSSFVNVLHFG